MEYKFALVLSLSIVVGLAQTATLPGKELDLVVLAIQAGDFNGASQVCNAVTSYALDQLAHLPPGSRSSSRIPASPDLLVMVDQSRAALEAGDFRGLVDSSVALCVALHKEYVRRLPTPAEVLAQLEQQAVGLTELQRFWKLPTLAKAALAAGDAGKATSYATEGLTEAAAHPMWASGDVIHQDNIVLGRVALEQGNLDAAKERLLAAGSTKGSAVLGSFGPNMALAKDLLTRGERTVVLQYLTECKQFWKSDKGRIDQWSAEIQGGVIPDFRANLLY